MYDEWQLSFIFFGLICSIIYVVMTCILLCHVSSPFFFFFSFIIILLFYSCFEGSYCSWRKPNGSKPIRVIRNDNWRNAKSWWYTDGKERRWQVMERERDRGGWFKFKCDHLVCLCDGRLLKCVKYQILRSERMANSYGREWEGVIQGFWWLHLHFQYTSSIFTSTSSPGVIFMLSFKVYRFYLSVIEVWQSSVF